MANRSEVPLADGLGSTVSSWRSCPIDQFSGRRPTDEPAVGRARIHRTRQLGHPSGMQNHHMATRRVPAWTRVAVYLSVAIATSASVGVGATSLSDAWATMNPFNASLVGLLWFGPMSVVLALAPVSRVVLVGLSAPFAVVVAGMWIAYAVNDSSTSALIFIWAWIAGVPLAAVVGPLGRKLDAGAGTPAG